MLPQPNTSHVAEARKLLIGQYREKRTIQAFLDAYVKRLQDVEDVLWDVIDARILDNATGSQLETLGRLVGENKRGRTDVQFRLGIRIRIRVNRSKGRITDVIDVAGLANAPENPFVEEHRYLNFHVETYNQVGEQYLADYLKDTRAASSYGCLVASDLDPSELGQFDDAVSPDATIQTFGDLDRTGDAGRDPNAPGCGRLAAACYGLPSDRRGAVLVGDPDAYPPPRIDCVDVDGSGNLILHGAYFTGATSVAIGGVSVTFTVLSDATISTPAIFDGEIEVTDAFGIGTYPYLPTAPIFFEFDFRSLSPGPVSAAALLATTAAWGTNTRGLTFTRGTVSTVQTSDTTVNSTPGINDACIGNRTSLSSKRGLVLENLQQNILQASKRNLASVGSGWLAEQNSFFGGLTVPTLTNGQTGPDGTNNATSIHCDVKTYVHSVPSGAGKCTFSSWQSGNSLMLMENAAGSGGSFAGSVGIESTSTGFQRLAITEGSTSTNNLVIVDGRDESTISPPATQHIRDCVVDCVQRQSGTFTTEAIVGGTVVSSGTYREDDRASYSVGSELLSGDGQIRCKLIFSPKFATTEHVIYNPTNTVTQNTAAYWWLLSWGATDVNYVRIKDSDKKLYVKIAGGTEVVSANAIAWSKFDEVTIEIEIGAGLPSVARYSVNGGAWVDLVLGAVADTPAPGANPIAILRDIDAPSRITNPEDRGQPPCWLHYLKFYGKTPLASLMTENSNFLTSEAGARIFTE